MVTYIFAIWFSTTLAAYVLYEMRAISPHNTLVYSIQDVKLIIKTADLTDILLSI